MPISDFDWACPNCHSPLKRDHDDALRCSADGEIFPRRDGIWRLLTASDQARLERFLDDYSEVRRQEGRGSEDPKHFQGLPFRDSSGRHRREWKIRSSSFCCLDLHVVSVLAKENDSSLHIADLGAGNGWLSNQLALKGHRVAALDPNTDTSDGLGACRHYTSDFEAAQADFDNLPFVDASLDLVIFNGSIHYSINYARTLCEALRTLKPGGALAILDSPVYKDPASGDKMLREMHEGFQEQYGITADAIPCRGFLTHALFAQLGEELKLEWQSQWPFYDLRWSVRPLIARLRRRREPASFGVLWAIKR